VFREGLTAVRDAVLARDTQALPGATSNHCIFCWYVLSKGAFDRTRDDPADRVGTGGSGRNGRTGASRCRCFEAAFLKETEVDGLAAGAEAVGVWDTCSASGGRERPLRRACSALSLSAQGPGEGFTAGGAATQIRTTASLLAEASLWPSGLKTAA
jgi:hypothetical protein